MLSLAASFSGLAVSRRAYTTRSPYGESRVDATLQGSLARTDCNSHTYNR